MFTEEETRPGRHDVIILGHGFWQRWFGGDSRVLGRRLAVQDGSLTIVGVAPPKLRIGLTEPDAYTPLAIDPANPGATGSRSFQCYGRLKPGISVADVRAEMTVIASALARQYPLDERMGVFVSGLHDYLVQEGRPALRLLMAVVATVLLIACVNLAGLLMARGMGRRGELAVRASLGASRVRLARQLVIESLVLAMFGSLAGLIVAYWATQALVMLTAGALTVGSGEPIRLDSTCLVFTLVVSTITALVFGLVPAWQASRVEPQTALREQRRGITADRHHHRLRSLLVVTEVALAVVLVAGAGLLLRTFSSLGTIQFLPLTGMNCGTGFWLEGQTPSDASRALPTDCSLVSRGYFAAMGIPILDGRPFDRRDRMGGPRVLIVNQSFARWYFPDGRVLGRRIRVHSSNQALAEIVGVVGDVRHNGLTSEPVPTVFLLHAQAPGYIMSLVVRTNGDATAQAAAVRRAIQQVDPTQAVSRGKVFLHLFGYGARLVLAGLVVGVVAAVGLRGVVSTLLFGVTPGDPVTYVMAGATFTWVALAVMAIPARRASRVEPMRALRYE